MIALYKCQRKAKKKHQQIVKKKQLLPSSTLYQSTFQSTTIFFIKNIHFNEYNPLNVHDDDHDDDDDHHNYGHY